MAFDKNQHKGLWPSCTSEAEDDENYVNPNQDERKEHLNKLRAQIQSGKYRPSIGEIAINLVKGKMAPDSFH